MSIDNSAATQLPIQCFLSYASADDEEYQFVAALKKSLEHACWSDGGRKLRIFVDRQDIGWGDNWRDKIADSLQNATVFLPVISRQYFDREACRTELQAFHAAADRIGVTDLLLPLLLFGKGQISGESDDLVVRLVEELQYCDIQDAVLAGPGTKEWRTTMLDVARRLMVAVEHAEKVIQDRDSALLGDRGQGGGLDDIVDGTPGLDELNVQMQAEAEKLPEQAGAVIRILNELTVRVTPYGQRMQGASRDDVRAMLADVARDVEDLGLDMQRLGGEMETTMSKVDAGLRQYYSLVMRYGTPEMKDSVRQEVAELASQFAEITETMTVMADFIAQIQPLELLSVPLRNSVRPLRTGVNSIHVALATMESWTRLGE